MQRGNPELSNNNPETIKLTSSEILEKKFGKLSIEIISQDELHRVSCLRTDNDNTAIACSTVDFHQQGIEAAPGLHTSIVAGSLLGKTIKDSGITHERKEFEWTTENIPARFQNIFNSEASVCASRKIEYYIQGNLYATIAEYYNPDYVQSKDFETL